MIDRQVTAGAARHRCRPSPAVRASPNAATQTSRSGLSSTSCYRPGVHRTVPGLNRQKPRHLPVGHPSRVGPASICGCCRRRWATRRSPWPRTPTPISTTTNSTMWRRGLDAPVI